MGTYLQWEVAAVLRYALRRIEPLGGQMGDAAHDIGGTHAQICVRYCGGGAGAACRGSHSRGHDWKLDLKPPLHCQEFLADRHGCLPRVRSRLWARADLGLPAAAGLLVRPLPMVALRHGAQANATEM